MGPAAAVPKCQIRGEYSRSRHGCNDRAAVKSVVDVRADTHVTGLELGVAGFDTFRAAICPEM